MCIMRDPFVRVIKLLLPYGDFYAFPLNGR